MKFNYIAQFLFFMSFFTTALVSCKKLVEIKPPITSTTGTIVFNNNELAIAALTNIYARTSELNAQLGNEGFCSISLFGGLSADEITLHDITITTYSQYYRNELLPNMGTNLWHTIYSIIFTANSAIEGLNKSNNVSSAVKQQLLGEAKFIRGFCYFYLVNLYGDVPLVTSSDYKINSTISRTSKSDVYLQITSDLKEAKDLLSDNFLDATLLQSTPERVRPTKWAAVALLARVYLFTKDWSNAEFEASEIIDKSSLFNIISLNDVFRKNSLETIWALQPVGANENSNTGEGKLFVLPDTGPDNIQYPIYLSNNLVNSFESSDKRKADWIGNITVNNKTYYYPYKYKIGKVVSPTEEYIMVFRLAEQYLIRAEARAHQNNLIGAAEDLNIIRSRASLPNTTAFTQPTLLDAIMHERQVELFTEWGHRWLDLKRTEKADAVMSTITPQKRGTWQTTDQLWPIPQSELNANPNLVQNPGY